MSGGGGDSGTGTYAPRLDGFANPTVWHEFSPLAQRCRAINLGQGFPDWPSPAFAKEALAEVVGVGREENQYTRSGGHPGLVRTVADMYSRRWGREIDANTEITTSVGATEGLFAALQAFVRSGDEVVVIEPAFDIYMAQVQMAGGTAVPVPLHEPEEAQDGAADGDAPPSQVWTLDIDEFRAALTDKTRAVILNNPHNPTGKVFSCEELQGILDALESFPDVIILTDEVYEHIVFDGHEHTSIATLSDAAWDRTLTVCSAGKTFSVTGWKVGWLIGPARLVKGVMLTNQWVQFSVPTPMQAAVALMLERAQEPFEGEPDFFVYMRKLYEGKRNRLLQGLCDAGFKPYVPHGGIFVMARFDDVYDECMRHDDSRTVMEECQREPGPDGASAPSRDWAFCRWLTRHKKVCAIPPSAFYCDEHKHYAEGVVRFAFCKEDSALEQAIERLCAK